MGYALSGIEFMDTLENMLVIGTIAGDHQVLHDIVVGFQTHHDNIFFVFACDNDSLCIVCSTIAVAFQIVPQGLIIYG